METPQTKTPPAVTLPTTIIRPSRGWVPVRIKDVLQFRELLYFLVWAELKVRYKQTVLGVAWAVIQPFAIMVVFAIFFGLVVRVPTGEIPYPLFTYSGLVLWTYFADALNRSSNSLVEYERLITKVYFPRLLVPMASVVAGLVDFFIAFVVLVGLIIYYGFVPEGWRTLYEIANPMAGVVEGFRWALLGGAVDPPSSTLVISVLMVAALLVGGLYYFRRVQRIFADVV